MNKTNLAYILLVLTTIFWSGNFIVGKAATIYEIPPFSLNFFRWLFASIILLPFTFKEIFFENKNDFYFLKKNKIKSIYLLIFFINLPSLLNVYQELLQLFATHK